MVVARVSMLSNWFWFHTYFTSCLSRCFPTIHSSMMFLPSVLSPRLSGYSGSMFSEGMKPRRPPPRTSWNKDIVSTSHHRKIAKIYLKQENDSGMNHTFRHISWLFLTWNSFSLTKRTTILCRSGLKTIVHPTHLPFHYWHSWAIHTKLQLRTKFPDYFLTFSYILRFLWPK